MEQLIQQVAAGLANGAIYACLALALVMIFVSTDHINFAQGELAMFSAFLCWQLLEWNMPFWLALPAVVLASFALGVGIERVVLRPLHSAPVLSIVVVFIGLLTIFHSLAGGIWGHTLKSVPSPFPRLTFPGSAYFGPHQVGMIVVVVALLVALFAFFRLTPLGLAMRAAAQNPASARLAGVRVDWMLALGWGLAAAVGAVAGVLIAPVVYLDPNMMAGILLYGFAGALVGGISSPGGAVAGGFLVGVIENLVAYFGNVFERSTGLYLVGNGEKLSVALIIVIVVLTLKPSGLFGHVTVKRV
jgi:branched-chain amino acid transport system permease protein